MFTSLLKRFKLKKLRIDHEVNYRDFRDNLETGDIVAWRGVTGTSIFDGLFARVIRLVTRHEIHHVGIVINTTHRAYVVEAIPPFIRNVPLSRRGNFFHIPMDIVETEEILYRIEDDIGVVYSIPDAVRSWVMGSVDSDNGLQCVEQCKLFLVEQGIEVPDTYLPGGFVDYMAKTRTITHVIH